MISLYTKTIISSQAVHTQKYFIWDTFSRAKMLENVVANILPALVVNGGFGSGADLVSIESDQGSKGDQFASNINFLTLRLKMSGEEVKSSVVVKQQVASKVQREVFNSKAHFNNEVCMYEHLLPMLDQGSGLTQEIFPKYYHGRSTLERAPEDDIVVLEDLRPSGYQLTEERLFIDYEHIVLALQQLGRFHALSYRAKAQVPDLFQNNLSGLMETLLVSKNRVNLKDWLIPGFMRSVTPLLETRQHVDVLERFVVTLSDPYEYMTKLVTPNEPTSVICHGDFCRNNMLFKYNSSGKPIAVKFFDLQTSRYASPAIDLTFFLYLNTTQRFRKDHWDGLLKIYYDALSTTFYDVTVPSFEDIRSEIVSRAIYGFIHCSFFLPMMVHKYELGNFEEIPEDWGNILAQIGGNECTQLITDIVEHLIQIGSIR